MTHEPSTADRDAAYARGGNARGDHVPAATATGVALAAGHTAPPEGGRAVVLSLVRDRNFSTYWVANFAYFLVFGAQRFAFVLLVLEITDRAGLGGLAGFAIGIPAFFLTIPAGVWADRLDRRRLVMAACTGGAAVASTVAVLWWAGAINAWTALGMALAAGSLTALVQPAMTAIVPMLVPREQLMSGIALRTMGQNLAQIFGFTIAGVSIGLVGFGGAFVVQAVIYLTSVAMMSFVRLPVAAPPSERPSMLRQAREGLRFVFRDPSLRSLIVISVVSGIFMIGPIFVLLPELARTKLDVSASLNGVLMAFIGFGMLISSLTLAMRSRVRRKGWWFISNLAVSGPLLVLMGFSEWYALTAFAIFLWGMSSGVFMNLNQTLVQGMTPNDMMGRAMSVFMLSIMGIVPMGSLIAGAGAELMGADRYLVLCGAIMSVFSIWTWTTQHSLRDLD